MDGVMFCLRLCCMMVAAVLSLGCSIPCAKAQSASSSDDYSSRIEPIFIGRCVACHSCYNAPCQLNLQSYSGVIRGANRLNIYDRSRPESVAPSRLDIDGHGASDWRNKGFFGVLDAKHGRTLLTELIALRAAHPGVQPQKPVEQSNFCPADADQAVHIAESAPELGMPMACRRCRNLRSQR